MRNFGIPVINYHSVGVPNLKWRYNHLTCPYKIFENQLKWLKLKKFHTISLMQLYNYMKNKIDLPKNPIVITFDDGYLDNWVFAYPLLKKYGFNGTIYVSPEFVFPKDIVRKTLVDVWKKNIKINQLKTNGFLSWSEMKEMEKEGIMDIQSHTMSHTSYFKSNKIVDFRHPGDKYIRITWNNNPDKKPFLQMDDINLIEYGEPIYENDFSLKYKRFFPDENLKRHLTNYVVKIGVKTFFNKNNWRFQLYDVVKKYVKKYTLDEKYESDEDYEKRIRFELEKSKQIIQKKLSKKVYFLCWPNDATTQKALSMSNKIGYLSSTVADDISYKKKHLLKNQFGDDPYRMMRRGPVLYWNGVADFNNKIKYENGFLFILSLYYFQKRKIIGIIGKSIYLGAKLCYSLSVTGQ